MNAGVVIHLLLQICLCVISKVVRSTQEVETLQYFSTAIYLSHHPLTSVQNLIEFVRGKPRLRWGH